MDAHRVDSSISLLLTPFLRALKTKIEISPFKALADDLLGKYKFKLVIFQLGRRSVKKKCEVHRACLSDLVIMQITDASEYVGFKLDWLEVRMPSGASHCANSSSVLASWLRAASQLLWARVFTT